MHDTVRLYKVLLHGSVVSPVLLYDILMKSVKSEGGYSNVLKYPHIGLSCCLGLCFAFIIRSDYLSRVDARFLYFYRKGKSGML